MFTVLLFFKLSYKLGSYNLGPTYKWRPVNGSNPAIEGGGAIHGTLPSLCSLCPPPTCFWVWDSPETDVWYHKGFQREGSFSPPSLARISVSKAFLGSIPHGSLKFQWHNQKYFILLVSFQLSQLWFPSSIVYCWEGVIRFIQLFYILWSTLHACQFGHCI